MKKTPVGDCQTFAEFDPKSYLEEYYSKIGSENHGLLDFFVHAYDEVSPNSVMLEFGGGPTVYPLISASQKVKEIHFADYIDLNLREVQLWQSADLEAFDWSRFFKKALKLEGVGRLTKRQIDGRMQLVRQKMVRFMHCNAFRKDPIDKRFRGYYDVINTNFVTESVTSSPKTWERLLANVCSLLKEDGLLVMTAIKDAQYYRIGDKIFPAVKINEEDMVRVLTKLGFQKSDISVYSIPAEVVDEELKGYTGYKGIIFLKARKKCSNCSNKTCNLTEECSILKEDVQNDSKI